MATSLSDVLLVLAALLVGVLAATIVTTAAALGCRRAGRLAREAARVDTGRTTGPGRARPDARVARRRLRRVREVSASADT